MKAQSPQAVPSLREASRLPEVVGADAISEVERLEAAIGVLGETNSHAQLLLNALRVAKSRSKLPPVEERVEACNTFLERARRRVICSEVITRAQEQKAVFVAEVEDAREGWHCCNRKHHHADPSVPFLEFGELQRQVEEFGEGTGQFAFRARGEDCGSVSSAAAGRRTTVHPFDGPRRGRSVDGRSAGRVARSFEQRQPCPGTRIEFRICKGSRTHDRDDPPNRHFRRRDSFTQGSRRRTVRSLLMSHFRNARYGLRGARVGEASHTGPPKQWVRRAASVPKEGL